MWTCFDVLLHPRLFCFVRNTADTCKHMLRTKHVLFAQCAIYARLTSLGDEGDTIKWHKYKNFYFIVYYIVFLLSCIFLILTFLTVTLPPKISCISICEMKWTQGKSDKAWEEGKENLPISPSHARTRAPEFLSPSLLKACHSDFLFFLIVYDVDVVWASFLYL